MSLALIVKQIAAIPAQCSVCGEGGPYVALPPYRDAADRRCKNHLWPDFFGPSSLARGVQPARDNSSGVDPFAPLDESRPGAHSAAPSAPVRAGPGDLFGNLT